MLFSLTTLILVNNQNAVMQTTRDRRRAQPARDFSEAQVRLVIKELQARGEDWTEGEIDYIVKNINRKELLSSLEKWENRRSAVITTKARMNLLIDYLLTELAGLKALPSYLDQIGTNQDRVGVSDRWKIEVSADIMTPSEYGRLKLVAIPKEAEVYISGDFEGYSDKEFVLAVGTYPVALKSDGFREFATAVVIERRKTYILRCELIKK
jgi:hypothetical protein